MSMGLTRLPVEYAGIRTKPEADQSIMKYLKEELFVDAN